MVTFVALASLRQKTLHGRGGGGVIAANAVSRLRNTTRWISSSQLAIEHQTDTTAFDSRPAKEKLLFGQTPSDHMLMIEFEKDSQQWGIPRIVPYQDLVLSPAASCLHYGTRDTHDSQDYTLQSRIDYNCSYTMTCLNNFLSNVLSSYCLNRFTVL